MSRLVKPVLIALLLALPLFGLLIRPEIGAAAQGVTVEPATLTAVFATITAQAAMSQQQTPFAPTPEPQVQPAINPEFTQEPTPFPSPTPTITDDQRLLLDARIDLETLATTQFGTIRPEGWSGASQLSDELALLTRLDLETLYSALVSVDDRPADWIGAVGSTPFAVARDIRHDLELVADLFYGPNLRPEGWRNSDPVLKCNRATQTLVALLARGGLFTLDVPANDPRFCYNAEIAVTRFVETQILVNAGAEALFAPSLTLLSENQVTTDFAVAWLDTSARIRVGVIPNGTLIQVIGRSYAQFSNMMLVSGPDFQVFVEYSNTTVTSEGFRSLPNVATLDGVLPVCYAEWCEG